MADGLNRVILLGNLGADPELRMTNSGTAILNLRLATSESYLDKNKQRQERTEWHRCTIWGNRAEALGKILVKGDRILVEGGLRTTSYEDKDGVKKYTTEINVTNVVLSGGGKGGGDNQRGGGSGGTQSRGNFPDSEYGGDPDDDVPFLSCSDIKMGARNVDRI